MLTTVSETTEPPHLLLYFDVNETLIAKDKAGNKTIDQVLNQLMGKRYKARWDESLEEPMTYQDYIKKVVLPGEDHDLEHVKKQRVYLDHFVDYLKETNHPLYNEVVKAHRSALEILEKSEGNIFLSFYRAIEALDKKRIPYSIVLRTFGNKVGDARMKSTVCISLCSTPSGHLKREC